MHDWENLPLQRFCKRRDSREKVDPNSTYPLAGIQLWGKGAYFRENLLGFNTKYKFLSKISAGDLILNKIWARNGAITIVENDLNQAFVSPEFPVYEIDNRVVTAEWMRMVASAKTFWKACDAKSHGTSGKNRIDLGEFLKIKVPIPPLHQQAAIMSRIALTKEKVELVRSLRLKQVKEVESLLHSSYVDLTKDSRFGKMAELAPITRRPVEIELEREYQELAARSFGKGTFIKPSFKGADLTWQKPYWVQEGDLLFSNIKAWEGAIALISEQEHDWVVSHRYITCVPDAQVISPHYLLYYLLSPHGLEQVGNASAGSADRNRTLSLRKLQNIEVPVPPLEGQQEFERLLHKVHQLKAHIAASQQELDELVPALLDKALKGELV